MKIYLASDYQEGAHPQIMDRLCETNFIKSAGYGMDEFCRSAREKIRSACACPNALVQFLVGGTQTNATVIDAFLRSYQGVIAADSGHISVHEAGAIEFGGHKVISIPHQVGKISAESIQKCCKAYWNDGNRDHMVMPGMVYISQPTEYGTLYSLAELMDISNVCREYHIPLYVDGARLAYALACEQNDVSLPNLARLCDVFYIGGTKCGALFGEAVVIPDPNRVPHFFSIIKQHGALLAKGRLLGIQFDTLFTDNLYQNIGKPAILAANRLRKIFHSCSFSFPFDSPTNQVFVTLENGLKERLAEIVEFSFWEAPNDTHTIVRFATSWSTSANEISELEQLLNMERKET